MCMLATNMFTIPIHPTRIIFFKKKVLETRSFFFQQKKIAAILYYKMNKQCIQTNKHKHRTLSFMSSL